MTFNVLGKISYVFDVKPGRIEPFISLSGISISDAAYEEREEAINDEANLNGISISDAAYEEREEAINDEANGKASVYKYEKATLFMDCFVTLGAEIMDLSLGSLVHSSLPMPSDVQVGGPRLLHTGAKGVSEILTS